jgi:hypothetical protein
MQLIAQALSAVVAPDVLEGEVGAPNIHVSSRKTVQGVLTDFTHHTPEAAAAAGAWE